MAVHIGKIIHDLIQGRRLKVKAVAQAINISESSIYKIYNRQTIDIDKLIKLSQFLDTNLFVHYLSKEPLKSMVSKEAEKLSTEVNRLKSEVIQKDKRITELENINASQQKVISLLETTSSSTPKRKK